MVVPAGPRSRLNLAERYDVALVGTGFATSFFLKRYLDYAGPDTRIIVLERGANTSYQTQLKHRIGSLTDHRSLFRKSGLSEKTWNFSVGFGGSSNCWWGNTPRMFPTDFELNSRCGVGTDWPFSYDDLEPYYTQAEEIIAVSGGAPHRGMPMSAPYPLPPHGLSDPEKALLSAFPDQYGPMPTARASRPTGNRSRCCANGVCSLCPVNAKFTVQNGIAMPYQDPRVTLVTNAEVRRLDIEGGSVTGVIIRRAGRERRIKADFIGLGANAIFNSAILLRSGDDHPLLGRRLHEQVGIKARVLLDGMDSFQGTTSVSGVGSMMYNDGERRKTRSAFLLETLSVENLRSEPGRWRQVLPIRLVYEDIPQDNNRVLLDKEGKPILEFNNYSQYFTDTVGTAAADLEKIFASLPVERIDIDPYYQPTEAHIQGTTVMGENPETSIADGYSLHHRYRNVAILGSSTFPTGAPANPTLTLSAMALRTADHLFGRAYTS